MVRHPDIHLVHRFAGLHYSEPAAALKRCHLRRVYHCDRARDWPIVIYYLPAAIRGDIHSYPGGDYRCSRAGQERNMIPMPTLPAAVPLSWYLLLSAILFALGVAGFLFRKNI